MKRNKKKIFRILRTTIWLGLLLVSLDVKAAPVEELNQEKTKLENRLNELNEDDKGQQREIDTLEIRKEHLGIETALLQKKIDKLTLRLVEQQEDLYSFEGKINELEKETQRIEERIILREEKLETQARTVQTDISPAILLETVINSENIVEARGNVNLINRIMSNNQEIIVQQKNDKEILVEVKQEVEEEKMKIEELRTTMEVAKTNLITQRANLENEIVQIGKEYELSIAEKETIRQEQQSIIDETSILSDELKKEQNRLVEEEATKQHILQEEAMEMAGEIAPESFFEESVAVIDKGDSSEESPSNRQQKKESTSGFIVPSDGVVTDPLGPRIHPITGERKLHTGIDIIAGSGPINAAQGGTILVAGFHNSWGYYVKMDHGNGFQTLYAHMEAGSLLVAPNQVVSQGQQLGIMGSTGDSTGIHLHFEIYERGVQINPGPYLGL